ncbi:dihydroneopterin triphosphate pyrophosphatase [Mesocricetibacter intestinalis]|uniref:Dihydroneopterin triphosphate pyrophosphatase n=1 Tax=Mesocricetibacter intestinalis TaxID=1521930 RepID=A0A4R6VG11_9PAST|nr:dihydroneopterin triphosphate diphosphatase [Mesocricetibacter intestinalis]TDQ59812.1 dihydroneopterin triphosphate pyrophosphatase [Mesocricetibacter intestinalis]
MKFKNPNSVLVVIYAQSSDRVLMLQRRDDPDFWQSVTGSLAEKEQPRHTALREVREETGIDIEGENLSLIDCRYSVEFEIFPHFRYKYAPNVSRCREHWFLLALPQERIPRLSEHLAYQWLEAEAAASLTKSPNNAAAIRTYLMGRR